MRRALVVVGVAAALALVWLIPGYQFDFSYDWLTGKAFVNGVDPSRPVDELANQFGLSTPISWSHPRLPGAVAVNGAFGFLPFQWMHYAGRILTVAVATWLGWLISRWTRWPLHRVIVVVPFVLLLRPFSDVLATSQWAVFAVAGLIGVTLFSRDGWWSGVPLALAATLKAWPWLIIPALWMSGRRRSAYGAAAAFGVFNGLVLLLPHVSTRGTVAALLSVPTSGPPLNLSPVQSLPLWVGPLCGLVAVCLVPGRWRLAAAVPLSLVASPVLWPAYLPTLLPVTLIRSRRLASPEADQPSRVEAGNLRTRAERRRQFRRTRPTFES